MSRKEKPKRKFTVKIYIEEYLQLCSWVLKHEHIETGGDLFGLWADDRTAVIQLVVGPGQNCSRTTVSFYQDVEYLKEVGSYLTGSEGLCHIGEWHSHHQLGLARPSGGDESTVWNNMPTYGLDRFVIFIANIDRDRQSFYTNVGCFLFEMGTKTGQRLPVLEGQFDVMNEKSPMRLKMETPMETTPAKENRAAKVFIEKCESFNNKEILSSLRITKYKETGRLEVSKDRVVTQPQHCGTSQGMGKKNAKQRKGTEAPRGQGASGQHRSQAEKEVKGKRTRVTTTTSAATTSNFDFPMAAHGTEIKKEQQITRGQCGFDEKQGTTQKVNGRGQQGTNKKQNEQSSSNKSQGKLKAKHPGHAKPQGK